MTAEERSSIENAVWLCRSHARLVDADESRFTVEMLKGWRRLAEERARLEQTYPGRPAYVSSSWTFVTHKLAISYLGSESEMIGHTLDDCCVSAIWPKQAFLSIRDLLIELTRNAFQHGAASSVSLEVTPRSVTLRHDGDAFNPIGLPQHQGARGGAHSIRSIRSERHQVHVDWRREGDLNIMTIAVPQTPSDIIESFAPCVLRISLPLSTQPLRLQVHESCTNIYIILPKYFSVSDAYRIKDDLAAIAGADAENRRLVIAYDDLSPAAREVLEEAFTEAVLLPVSYGFLD